MNDNKLSKQHTEAEGNFIPFTNTCKELGKLENLGEKLIHHTSRVKILFEKWFKNHHVLSTYCETYLMETRWHHCWELLVNLFKRTVKNCSFVCNSLRVLRNVICSSKSLTYFFENDMLSRSNKIRTHRDNGSFVISHQSTNNQLLKIRVKQWKVRKLSDLELRQVAQNKDNNKRNVETNLALN